MVNRTNMLFIAFSIVFGIAFAREARQAEQIKVKEVQTGELLADRNTIYSIRGGDCQAEKRQGCCDTATIVIRKERNRKPVYIFKDVSGAFWITKSLLAISTGPIYATSGIYVYSCNENELFRIVSPRCYYESSEGGADYFMLKGIEGDRLYFYYTPDINDKSIDMNEYRTDGNMYSVKIDGTGLKKVTGAPAQLPKQCGPWTGEYDLEIKLGPHRCITEADCTCDECK